jgi:ribosomal-protein-alanine N-acetyltransferase
LITNVVPRILTERTIVRLAERKDREKILEYYSENRDRLSASSVAWPDNFFTKQFWDKQIDRNLEEFYADLSARMFVFEKSSGQNQCIGNISLSGILRHAAQFCYLGYGVDKDYEGRGIMKESVSAVVQYAFNDLALHRVMANYMPTNERSGKLLRSLGFVVEGYAHDYLYLNGKWQDHILASITNPNWTPS